MKIFLGFVIFSCLAFPVFSQSPNTQRFRTLSDSMGTSITRSTATLADFDERSASDGSVRTYTTYRVKYDKLVEALGESEVRMNLHLRSNDRFEIIKAERDIYDSLIKELEAVKSDYDNWLRTVQ